jgi:hypothetical protein
VKFYIEEKSVPLEILSNQFHFKRLPKLNTTTIILKFRQSINFCLRTPKELKFSGIPFLICTFREMEVVAKIVQFPSNRTDYNILKHLIPEPD